MGKKVIKGRKDSRIPSYVDVYNQLYRDLEDGVYPKGSLLEGEHQLAQKYNVSRNTLRQALAVLTQDGYIYKHQGKGTFVSYDQKKSGEPKIYNYLLESTREEITNVEMDFNISMPTEIARSKMRLKEGIEVLASNNVYLSDEGPISHSFVQIPMSYIESKGIDVQSEEELYQLINETIYQEGHGTEVSFQCIMADEQIIPFLGVDESTAVFYVEQLIYDTCNDPIARVKYHFLVGKYKITLQL